MTSMQTRVFSEPHACVPVGSDELGEEVELIDSAVRHHDLTSRQWAGEGVPRSGSIVSGARIGGGCWTGAILDRGSYWTGRIGQGRIPIDDGRAQRTAGDVPHIVRPVAGLDSGWKEHEPIENNGGDIVIYSSPRKSGGAPCASSTSASKPQLAIMSTQPIAVDIMATQPFTVDIQPVLTNARPAAITDAPCALAASNANANSPPAVVALSTTPATACQSNMPSSWITPDECKYATSAVSVASATKMSSESAKFQTRFKMATISLGAGVASAGWRLRWAGGG